MEAHLKEDQTKTVTLKVGKESAEATLEEFGIYYRDMEKTADKAVSYGKDGGVFSQISEAAQAEERETSTG